MRTAQLVGDGDEVTVGRVPLRIVHLVGHTPGSIAVLYEPADGSPHLFTGDSLFPGGPGNTQGDPERFHSLMDDLERKIFGPLPDETWVYPGHGKDTTLGAERPAPGRVARTRLVNVPTSIENRARTPRGRLLDQFWRRRYGSSTRSADGTGRPRK